MPVFNVIQTFKVKYEFKNIEAMDENDAIEQACDIEYDLDDFLTSDYIDSEAKEVLPKTPDTL